MSNPLTVAARQVSVPSVVTSVNQGDAVVPSPAPAPPLAPTPTPEPERQPVLLDPIVPLNGSAVRVRELEEQVAALTEETMNNRELIGSAEAIRSQRNALAVGLVLLGAWMLLRRS